MVYKYRYSQSSSLLLLKIIIGILVWMPVGKLSIIVQTQNINSIILLILPFDISITCWYRDDVGEGNRTTTKPSLDAVYFLCRMLLCIWLIAAGFLLICILMT